MLLVVGRVGQGVYICGEASGGRRIYPANVVVDANLLRRRLDRLLDEVDKIWRAEFSKGL